MFFRQAFRNNKSFHQSTLGELFFPQQLCTLIYWTVSKSLNPTILFALDFNSKLSHFIVVNELAILILSSVKNTCQCVKQSLEAYYIHQ